MSLSARRSRRNPTIAIVSTYPPRQCGIATFSQDLRAAILGAGPATVEIVALDDEPRPFPPEVAYRIRAGTDADHREAARWLRQYDHDVVILQHEFGIFGGPDGERVLDLVEQLDRPLITTLHTILREPSHRQARIVEALFERSERVMVMSRLAADRLMDVYDADPSKIQVTDHGVPDLPRDDPRLAKRLVRQPVDRPLVLSNGLLGPGKGYELAIEAMADVVRVVPNARYVVLGTTHPEQRRRFGEAYREKLRERADSLHLSDTVELVDAFVDATSLGEWLQAADVYVTPYPGVDQIVSGTLAYAVGAGKAIVSTPYAYARELLADGVGTVSPFGDARAMAQAITRYLVDPRARDGARERAYSRGRRMIWPAVGETYLALVDELVGGAISREASTPAARQSSSSRRREPLRDAV